MNQTSSIALLQCQDCGLAHIIPLPDMQTVEQFYREEYSRSYIKFSNKKFFRQMKRKLLYELKSRISLIRAKSQEKFICRFCENFNKGTGKNILDIGCGTGSSLCRFHKKGWEANGLEMNPYFVEKLKEKMPEINIVGESIEAYLSKNKFDFIIISHVFEHFSNPLTVLEKVKTLLKKDGLVFIEVPNINDQRLKQCNTNDIEHTFFYNPVTLKEIVHKAGLVVRRISTVSPLELEIGNDAQSVVNSLKRHDTKRCIKYLFSFGFNISKFLVSVFFSKDTVQVYSDDRGTCIRLLASL